MAMIPLEADGQRLWNTLMASAEIGALPEGGLRRLALSDADGQVRDLFARWAVEAGYQVSVDQLGTMVLRRQGSSESLPPVVIGSHLDTQWAGGRFDGILGVLAGLEVLRSLDDNGIETLRPIEVVNWTNEEGARFQPPMLCSLVFAGQASVEWVYERQDREGRRFRDELERIGYRGIAPVHRPIDSYFELHIEQGPILDANGLKVGIVTGGYPTRGMRILVRGENAHVGPTPMERRSNALVGAALVAAAVNDIGWQNAGADGKTTAARLDLEPNLPGIISHFAQLYIDFRHPDTASLLAMEEGIRKAIVRCAENSRTNIEIAETWGFGGLEFDPDLVELLSSTAKRLGITTMDLKSQAGHDAYNVAAVAPACMIFTPCDEGVSHNVRENTRLEDQLPGINVLLNAAVARANRN
jgi:N-carbamoyl-L-amino-acid hydrolase